MEVGTAPQVGLTKNLTELCILLIDDMFGELPSRIFATLLSKGRSSTAQLKKHTSLSPKQLRHGLAVLMQQNLLYFYTDDKLLVTFYEANSAAAYGLVRTGKISGLVEARYGSAARDVVQSLLSLGHTRIADLRAAYRGKIRNRGKSANVNGAAEDPFGSDDDGMLVDALDTGPSDVKSMEHLDDVLVQLLRADVVEVVNPQAFCSPIDRSRDVQDDIKKKFFPNEPRGAKQKDEYEQLVAKELRELRELPKTLKRPLVGAGIGRRPKARKLFQSDVSNGVHDDDDGDAASLDANAVLRVNQERCLVELRNQALVKIASGAIGETTGHVYAVLLRLLTDPIPRCRLDTVMDSQNLISGQLVGQNPVSTADILKNLNSSLDVAAGIGKADRKRIDIPTAERLRRNPPQPHLPTVDVDGEASDEEIEDLEEDDDGYDDEAMEFSPASPRHANGTKDAKVTFEDAEPPRESRLQQMRQHLLLLCESRYGFVRHCGRGLWTVDFTLLLRRIQETELDNVIERKLGRPGLRLALVLRKHGKLDDKAILKLVLMSKGTMQNTLLRMQVYGFAEIQEVPKDNSRTATRTLFFWYCDMERCLSQLLDNTYKAMLRCLQIRKAHQHKNSDVLTFVERPDVKGREKEALEKKYFNKYEQYRDTEGKLLNQVMRLDDLVAILRDY